VLTHLYLLVVCALGTGFTQCLPFQRVRFAGEDRKASPAKVEMKDAEVWTQEPEYDHFLFFRLFSPVGMTQSDIKCSVAFGKQYFKTKKLDIIDKTPGNRLAFISEGLIETNSI